MCLPWVTVLTAGREVERKRRGRGGEEKDGGKGERGGTGKEYYITTELWLYGQPLLTVRGI